MSCVRQTTFLQGNFETEAFIGSQRRSDHVGEIPVLQHCEGFVCQLQDWQSESFISQSFLWLPAILKMWVSCNNWTTFVHGSMEIEVFYGSRRRNYLVGEMPLLRSNVEALCASFKIDNLRASFLNLSIYYHGLRNNQTMGHNFWVNSRPFCKKWAWMLSYWISDNTSPLHFFMENPFLWF